MPTVSTISRERKVVQILDHYCAFDYSALRFFVLLCCLLFEGCKINNVGVVYTPWANLKKTGDMAVGQVGFHRHKEVSSSSSNFTISSCEDVNPWINIFPLTQHISRREFISQEKN